MNEDFFDRLEAELGGITRQGRHLDRASGRARRRLVALARRGAFIVVLVAALLTASLIGGSPTAAGFQGLTPRAAAVSAP